MSFTTKKTPNHSHFCRKNREQRWPTTDRIQGDSRTSWCRDWYRGSQSDVGTGVTFPQTASWRQPGKSSGDISPPVDTSTIINKKQTSLFIFCNDDFFFSIKVMAKLNRKTGNLRFETYSKMRNKMFKFNLLWLFSEYCNSDAVFIILAINLAV